MYVSLTSRTLLVGMTWLVSDFGPKLYVKGLEHDALIALSCQFSWAHPSPEKQMRTGQKRMVSSITPEKFHYISASSVPVAT
jgi:hypothetical protein